MASHLVIDNYDSFTYNLVHILEGILNEDLDVFRVDEVQLDHLDSYQTVIISPGPGLPSDSDYLIPIVRKLFENRQKVLGVCLGMQAMANADGAELKNLDRVHHGVSHKIFNLDSIIYKGLEEPVKVGRYHSWVVNEENLNLKWKVTSRDQNGEVMSMEHKTLPFYGIQFHPESVLSPDGRKILANFLAI